MIVTKFYEYIPDVYVINLGAYCYVTKDYRTAYKIQEITKETIYTMLPYEKSGFIWDLVSYYEGEPC